MGVLPPLTAQRLDIFSFSHMRRLHLHHSAPDSASTSSSSSGLGALKTLKTLEGTVSEQLDRRTKRNRGSSKVAIDELDSEAIDIMDAQMKSGIGFPLVKAYAEYFSGSAEINTVLGHGTDTIIKISKFGVVSII